MTAEQVRAVREANPFQPFTLHLSDGQTFHVPHRGFVSQSPSGRIIIVYDMDDAAHFVDLYLVTSIEVQSTPSGSPSGAGGGNSP